MFIFILLIIRVLCIIWKGEPCGGCENIFSHAMTPTRCLINMQTWKHILNLLVFCDFWFLCSRKFCSFEGYKSLHFFFPGRFTVLGLCLGCAIHFEFFFCLQWKPWTGIRRFARCTSNCPAPLSGKTFTQWLYSHNWKSDNHSYVALSLISHPQWSFF